METYASGHAFSPSPQPLSVSTYHEHASPSTAAAAGGGGEAMAYMENDGKMIFEELLDAEVAINMPKLREASRLGIPAALRSTVYRYLLGIAFMDKSSEMTIERMQEKDFDALVAAYKETWLGQGRGRDGGGGGGGGGKSSSNNNNNNEGSNNNNNTTTGGGGGSHGGGGSASGSGGLHHSHRGTGAGAEGPSTGGVGHRAHSSAGGGGGVDNTNATAAVGSVGGGNNNTNTTNNNNNNSRDENDGDDKDNDAEGDRARAQAAWLRHRVELAMEKLSRSQLGAQATATTGLYDGTSLLLRAAPASELESYAYWARAWSRIRHRPPYCDDVARRQQLEQTLGALQVTHHTASAEHVEVLVALSVSLARVHATASAAGARDVFFYVETVYFILTHYGNILQDEQSLQIHCGTFQMLFHALNPTLYDHFVREGIATLEWVPGMLMALLAGRLPETNLLRLWDCYFADAWTQLGFPLHPYICLAILASLTEDLLECSKMSILRRLRHLPAIDTSALLHRAVSMRESVYEHGLL